MLLATLIALGGWCGAPQAATFTVTSTADAGAIGTPRRAIHQTNAAGACAHDIRFNLSSNATIALTSPFESWGANFGPPAKPEADHG
jgi:hypothetical protein